MRRKENAKRMMIISVISFFRERKGIAIKIKQLDEAVKLLTALESELAKKEPVFTENISGNTESRHRHRAALIDTAMVISGGMVAFAEKFKKKQLMKQANYPFSKLNRANDAALVSMCRVILKDARQIKRLDEFGVEAGKLVKLEQQIKLFEEKAPLYYMAKKEKAAAHTEMKKLVNEMCRLLKYRIDKMMATMKDDKETEFELYKLVRRAICYGRKRKVKLRKAINQLTGEVMTDVTVDIVQEAETLVNDFINEQQQKDTFKTTIRIEKKGFKPLIIENADLRMLELIEAALVPEEAEVAEGISEPVMLQEETYFDLIENKKMWAGMYE